MPPTGLPFDDIRALFQIMPPASQECVDMVRARDAELVKPAGALGRLEEIVEWLAAWQGKSKPTIDRPLVAIDMRLPDRMVLRQPPAPEPAPQQRRQPPGRSG